MEGGWRSISRIRLISGSIFSIGISFMGTTRSGSPSEIFYACKVSYLAEKACEIGELDPLIVVRFFLYFSIKFNETHWEVDRFVRLVVDQVDKDPNKLLHLDFVLGEFLTDLINFESIEVGQVELLVIFFKQVAGLLRVSDEVGNHLANELLW